MTESFDVERHDLAWAAFHDFQHANVDFADCIISHLNRVHGAEQTYTFDKKAAKLPFNTLLKSSALPR